MKSDSNVSAGTAGVAQSREPVALGRLTAYFLRLGAIGFGGVALVGIMHRDLVEQRRWLDEDTYKLALALSQLMPGPVAAQLVVAIGYFQHGLAGAIMTGFAFILPAFVLVVGLAGLYLTYGALWWIQALLYSVGAAVIAIVAVTASRLARSTNKRDPLLWGIFVVLAVLTGWTRFPLAPVVIVAGLVVLLRTAPPAWLQRSTPLVSVVIWPLLLVLGPLAPVAVEPTVGLLLQILFFFLQANAFVFGSGYAIIPFLHQGVVQQFGWLTERQFLDAVAITTITPGPVVITVAFIGFLVAGFPGAIAAAIGIFGPVYVFTIVPAAWFRRHRNNAQLRAFVQGATAAVTGAMAGSAIVLAQRAIVDLPTAGIAVVGLILLGRFKVPDPLVVVGSAVTGLVLWPLVGGGH